MFPERHGRAEPAGFLRIRNLVRSRGEFLRTAPAPQQHLDKPEARKAIIGGFEWNSITSFGGLPFDEVEISMRLIGAKVIPELRSW